MIKELKELAEFNTDMQEAQPRRAYLINQARAAGATWRAIAETLGLTEAGAMKAAKPALRRGRPRRD